MDRQSRSKDTQMCTMYWPWLGETEKKEGYTLRCMLLPCSPPASDAATGNLQYSNLTTSESNKQRIRAVYWISKIRRNRDYNAINSDLLLITHTYTYNSFPLLIHQRT